MTTLIQQPSRKVHIGHIKTTLRKVDFPVPPWLTHVDQAPSRSVIRNEKEKFARELLKEKQSIGSLFGETARAALSSSSNACNGVQNTEKDLKRKKISDALKMYRILQPDALPFYKQDAMNSMKAKLNQLGQEISGLGSGGDSINNGVADPFSLQLPVVNPTSFMIALEAATRSLADDLEGICVDVLGIEESSLPEVNHPERFLLLVRLVFNAFPLRKDPAQVDQFMIDSWPRLKRLLPEDFPEISDQGMADLLRGHLDRVIANQRGSSLSRNEWYDFSVDFEFDSFLNPRSVGGKQEFDISKIKDQTARVMKMFGVSDESIIAETASQLQQFVYDCDKIGLKRWLSERNIDEIFDANLPRGPIPALDPAAIKKEDISTAKLMLRCAARGRINLMDFDSLDPDRLLHSAPTRSVEEELSLYDENKMLQDSEIDRLIDLEIAAKSLSSRSQSSTSAGTVSPLEQVLESEKEFARTAGPAEWKNGEWHWKKPSGAVFDSRIGKYVRNQSLVDPNLDLSTFRQFTCDVRRMCSMSSAGRVYYARSIVVVGNGQGIYGFGVGFGNTPRESNSDAAVKALRNLRYVDYDATRTLTTPVRGSEYKARLFLRPLRQGKKLRAGRRFLPLFYILGLHNVRARFNHTGWFPRINAVIRALDQIQSRRTLANSTGMKYADITVPGDHWVHWPDRWFDVIRRSYQSNEKRVKAERRRVLHNKTRGHVVASPMEVRPGWTKYAWMNPLAKWSKEVGRSRITAKSVKQLPVTEFFPPSLAPTEVPPLIES